MLKNIIDTERLIHSTKTAIACMIGILFARMVGTTADQWIVITIIVVMCAQIYVGSVIQKAYLRFLGTLVGCLFAATTLVTAGGTSMSILITIALSSFIFSYLATGRENLTYAATLGAVTTAIIMLGQHPTISFAVLRFLEISVGLFIATIVSQYILPIHASTHLRRSQAKTLEQLRDYYIITMTTHQTNMEIVDYQELDESIAKSLLKQRQLAKESASESDFDRTHFMQSLYCEREILRSMTFMHNALIHIKKLGIAFNELPDSHAFNEAIVQSLNTLIKAIESEPFQSGHIHTPSLNSLKDELQKNTSALTREDLIYIDGFLFSAEILLNSLAKLSNLYNVIVYPATKTA